MPLRAGLYERVSKDQRQGRSVEEQDAKSREDCQRNGWAVAETYVDNDRGASRHSKGDRPDFARLVADIEDSRLDVVVCWEASRLQRDLAVYVQLRDLCHKHGVLWSYSGRIYDMSRTDDRFQTGLDALLSEREADVTRDRVRRAMRANAVQGRPHGRLLYGYQREYDQATGALLRQVPREDQAEVVREAGRRIAAYESCRSIALDFTDRGIPTPQPCRSDSAWRRDSGWTPQQIKVMLINPGYIGKRVHQGRVLDDVEACWPPILDEETYYTCLRILTDPARQTGRTGTAVHLLSGIAICGVCEREGRGVVRLWVRKNHRKYLIYVCPQSSCVVVRVERIESYVTGAVLELLSRRDILETLGADVADDGAASARSEIEEKRARLDGFVDAAAAGELSPGALARIETRLLAEIAALRVRAHPRGVSPLLRRLVAGDVRAEWGALGVEQRRVVVQDLMEVRIMPTGAGRKPLDPARVRLTPRYGQSPVD